MTEKESRIKAIAIMKKSGSILGFSGRCFCVDGADLAIDTHRGGRQPLMCIAQEKVLPIDFPKCMEFETEEQTQARTHHVFRPIQQGEA